MTISSTPSRPETTMPSSMAPETGEPPMPDTLGINYYDADRHLAFMLRRMLSPEDFARAEPHLRELGRLAGERLDALAIDANKHTPQLINFDKRGQRVDEIIFHPSYHELGRVFYEQFGIAAMSYRDGVLGWPEHVPHLVKFALAVLGNEAEGGIFCPLSMTDTLSRVLLMYAPPDVQKRYVPRLTATDRKSTRLNSSHVEISYAVFCLKKKKKKKKQKKIKKKKNKKKKKTKQKKKK